MPECVGQTHLQQDGKKHVWLPGVGFVAESVRVRSEGFEDGAEGVVLGV